MKRYSDGWWDRAELTIKHGRAGAVPRSGQRLRDFGCYATNHYAGHAPATVEMFQDLNLPSLMNGESRLSIP